MFKLFFGSWLLVLLSVISQAQYPGYQLLSDGASFKTRFAVASQKINTIKSDFRQEKELSLLSEKIVSRGKFFFKRENAVRMEYQQPFQYLMIINGSKIYIKDSQKENRVSAKSNKLFEQINKIMINCVNGSALESKDFTVRIFEATDSYLAELSPLSNSLKTLFSHINLQVAKKELGVTRIEMLEPGGDKTTIHFLNREINTVIADALFAVN